MCTTSPLFLPGACLFLQIPAAAAAAAAAARLSREAYVPADFPDHASRMIQDEVDNPMSRNQLLLPNRQNFMNTAR